MMDSMTSRRSMTSLESPSGSLTKSLELNRIQQLRPHSSNRMRERRQKSLLMRPFSHHRSSNNSCLVNSLTPLRQQHPPVRPPMHPRHKQLALQRNQLKHLRHLTHSRTKLKRKVKQHPLKRKVKQHPLKQE